MDSIITQFLENDTKEISMHRGENSSVCVLESSKNTYVLRCKDFDPTRTHPLAEATFLQALEHKSLPVQVPRVIPTKNGQLYVSEDKIYSLFSYIKGEILCSWDTASFSSQEITQIFTALAKCHDVFATIKIQDFPTHSAKEICEDLQCYPDNKIQILAKEINENLARQEYFSLPTYPVHNDFHRANMVWEKGCFVGLIDFEWSRYAPFAWEFCKACSMLCCAFVKGEPFNTRPLKVAFDAYTNASKHPLPNIKLLQEIMRLTCLHHLHWGWSMYKRKNEMKYETTIVAAVKKLQSTDFTILFV